jgi:hypothetical protein
MSHAVLAVTDAVPRRNRGRGFGCPTDIICYALKDGIEISSPEGGVGPLNGLDIVVRSHRRLLSSETTECVLSGTIVTSVPGFTGCASARYCWLRSGASWLPHYPQGAIGGCFHLCAPLLGRRSPVFAAHRSWIGPTRPRSNITPDPTSRSQLEQAFEWALPGSNRRPAGCKSDRYTGTV